MQEVTEEQDLYRNAELVATVQRRLETGHQLDSLHLFIRDLLERRAWVAFKMTEHSEVTSYHPGDALKFWEFVQKPTPKGLGTTIPKLRRFCAADEDAIRLLDLLDASAAREPGGANNPHGCKGKPKDDTIINDDNIHSDCNNDRSSPTGTSREAALRKLRKDRPDLHEQVVNGDKTPHAAMLEAGFRKPTMTVPKEDIPALARALRNRLTDDQIAELIDHLEGAA
jgi:hypothetical protein